MKMVDVVVAYGEKDKSSADLVANAINQRSGGETKAGTYQTADRTIGTDQVDGLVIIGGSNANQMFDELGDQYGWADPQSTTDTVFYEEDHNGIPVVALAGWEAEQTFEHAENFANGETGTIGMTPAIDQFILDVQGFEPELPEDEEEEENGDEESLLDRLLGQSDRVPDFEQIERIVRLVLIAVIGIAVLYALSVLKPLFSILDGVLGG